MIVKKIPSSPGQSTKVTRIARLVAYIRDPLSSSGTEKCIYAGARGFLTESADEQVDEMCALSLDAVRSRDPINHYVLSWREGEHPTKDHVEEAVSIFLDMLGLSEHQAVYGLHADTDNVHLHICLNRVIPWHLRMGLVFSDRDEVDVSAVRSAGIARRTVAEINKGFDLEAAHMAVARITHVQGWMPEKNARFGISVDGEIYRSDRRGPHSIAVSTRQADMEAKTGQKSAERVAKEIAAPLIASARSWDELHLRLAAEGIRYEKTGSGATIFVGEIPVKASAVDRKASLAQLVTRLGGFRSAAAKVVSIREPEPLQDGVPGWTEYTMARHHYSASRRLVTSRMRQQHSQEQKQLAAEYCIRRDSLFAGSWKGRGHQLNALRSALAAEYAATVASLKDRQKAERVTMRRELGPFPDLEQWLRDRHGPAAASRWRQRSLGGMFWIEGIQDAGVAISPTDIRAFSFHVRSGGETHYCRCTDSWPAFVDYGRHVGVFEPESEDAVLAALQLAAAKWPGGISVNGNDAFVLLCAKLAASHGIVLHNPRLESPIDIEQNRPLKSRSATEVSAGLEI